MMNDECREDCRWEAFSGDWIMSMGMIATLGMGFRKFLVGCSYLTVAISVPRSLC